MNKVIVIAGPTASGKTSLSLSLAERLNGEIVSADSMQIYRRMDIGTAKASAAERARVPHHMIDIAEPDEDYSVARYVNDAARCCDDILERGKLPLIVGGTGLYIDSLLSGRSFGERDEDPSLRNSLNVKYDTIGGDAMLEELREFDPDRAALLHSADRKRIIRAFEVYILSGKTISQHDAETRALPSRYEALFIIPGFRNRSALYSRIDIRVDDMLESGLVNEVRKLLESGISSKCTAMQAIGYKEIAEYLKGNIPLDSATETIKQSSRRYAKRQLTWFGRRMDALRLYRDESEDISVTAYNSAREFLS